jgi:hypothetical protein
LSVVLALMVLSPRQRPTPIQTTPPAAEPGEAAGVYKSPVIKEPAQELSKLARRVDYALLQALMLSGYGPDNLEIKEAAMEVRQGEPVPFQVLEIRLDSDSERFLDELEHGLETWAQGAKIAREEDGSVTIASLERVTHQLFIFSEEPVAAKGTEAGKMAVVIDDLGRDLGFARHLAALDIPVTFSILPGAPACTETASLAAHAGREVMLHQPMEPEGYPEVNPGPGALLTSMNAAAIRTQLAKNLQVIPEAKGVNNHTGSRYTQIESALDPVMDELGKRKLFFLDSLTTPKSVASAVAKKHGLAYYRRNIFLDNVRDTKAILDQLAKAERIARVSKQAIAIGHPYPETLEALRAWQSERGQDVVVVSVSKLTPVHRP